MTTKSTNLGGHIEPPLQDEHYSNNPLSTDIPYIDLMFITVIIVDDCNIFAIFRNDLNI